MVNFYARHGMVVEKNHEKNSFKQSMLEKNIKFQGKKNKTTPKKSLRKTSIIY